ncbi:MAG TPA: beta-galactosidase, partial [Solirubrobacteraceae bacterium]|nr:beta-galactosidase [Solirubrobacteraceae bacterium]
AVAAQQLAPARMRARHAALALAVATALFAGGCGGGGSPGGSHTAPPVSGLPDDFLGIVSNDAFAASGKDRAQILASERRTGVELLRETFDWATIEPTRGHFDFAIYDAFIAATARAGLQVLPIVFGRPSFEPAQRPAGGHLTATTTSPPARLADYAQFAAILVRRYGPRGTFWHAHPGLAAHPIRSWQIWNEPNLPVYWAGKPSAAGYVAMLAATARAIRAVDAKAEIVTAGIPDSTLGIALGPYVSEMLAAGARGSFDTLAINPYASSTAGVLAATAEVRHELDQAGLKQTPIWLTEIGWASGGPPSGFTVGPQLQARYVLDTITSLAREAGSEHIRGIVYFDWRDAPPYAGGEDFWGLHTGLLALNGSGKPALSAYYQAAGVLGTLPSQRSH